MCGGTCALLIIAGVDTTWSAIGAALWHMAQHPEDRRRWVEDPSVRPFAVEEFLRFYAPVTMARLVATDTEFAGPLDAGRRMGAAAFPVRQPATPRPSRTPTSFVIDRQRNRHVAFGLGIHRCLGSNLARMELTVALEEWMATGARLRAGRSRGREVVDRPDTRPPGAARSDPRRRDALMCPALSRAPTESTGDRTGSRMHAYRAKRCQFGGEPLGRLEHT